MTEPATREHPLWKKYPWAQIMWPLLPPPEVLGNLDWFSGIVFLNQDRATFERLARIEIIAEAPADDEAMMRTTHHEFFHYLQILTTGYLHRWVAALHALFRKALTEAGGLGEDFDGWAALVVDLPNRVSAELLADLRDHEADLHRRNADGLSIMTLVESHAEFVELRTTYDMNALGYEELLRRDQAEGDYRAAYDWCQSHVRNRAVAHEAFPLLCSLALCSSDPVGSFLREVRWLDVHSADQEGPYDLDVSRLVHDCCGPRYFDSPVSTAAADRLDVRLYDVPLRALRAFIAAEKVDIHEVFARPGEYFDRLLQVAMPLVVMRRDDEGGFHARYIRPDDESAGVGELLQAALHRSLYDRYAAEAEDEPAPAAEPRRAENVSAAHAGNVDALFNLGMSAYRGGRFRAAEVWWRLAASEGDLDSVRALGLTLSSKGDAEAERWLAHSRAALEGTAGAARPVPISAATLIQLGLGIDDDDPDAADECFRRCYYRDDVQGCFRYGSRVIDRDPAEGLFYLVCAAGAGTAIPVDADTLRWALEADRVVREHRKAWGRWKFRRISKLVNRRLQDEIRKDELRALYGG